MSELKTIEDTIARIGAIEAALSRGNWLAALMDLPAVLADLAAFVGELRSGVVPAPPAPNEETHNA